MHVRLLVAGCCSLVLLGLAVSGLGKPGGERGNFPVREPDESTPFYVLYYALKAGLDDNEEAGFKAYLDLCPEDRKADKDKQGVLRKGEWASVKELAGAYLAYDLHGFKVIVLKMNPAEVDGKTKKVYFTIKNQIEPDERSGLCIVERDGKGKWKLRSLSL
jgi:hypothetical protein